MYQKYCEKNDLDFLREKYSEEIRNLELQNDDCTYKNFIIYDFVLNSTGGREKFLDCGSGPSPLAWLLCNFFENGYMIDLSVKNKFERKNLHHNIGDFFSYVESHEDNSLDYALDGCSITHFEYSPEENIGMKKAANVLYRKIKKEGFLVIASDVIPHNDPDYHSQKEFLKVDDLIEIYHSEGFETISDFDYSSLNDLYKINLDYHGISNFDLSYCNLIFRKI